MSETVQPSRRRIAAIVGAGAIAWAAGPLLVLFDTQRHQVVAESAGDAVPGEVAPVVAAPASEQAPAEAVAKAPVTPAGGELLPASTDAPPTEPKPEPVSVSG